MTIFGWDASDFDWENGPMDLDEAAQDGIVFFSFKATEGTATKHSHYGETMSRARSAEIPFLGAYHVVRSVDIPAQLDRFLEYVDAATPWWREFPDWFFQVDLEKWKYDPVSADTGTQFTSLLTERTGRVAILYASREQYGDSLHKSHYPLWNADYGPEHTGHYTIVYPGDFGRGWTPYSGRVPVIWQFGRYTKIGSQPNCDANAFRGTEQDFRQFIDFQNVPGTLRKGQRGEGVRWVQRRLQAHGYDPGPADGIFGAQTEDAVRLFQEANHLNIDGVVGPRTRRALETDPT